MREVDAAVIEQGDDDIPATTAAALLEGRPVLVLAPHPDDESLGCGALLAHAFVGPGALVVCLTDGAASHPNSRRVPPQRLAAIRRAELDEAVQRLGGASADVAALGQPDAGLAATDALVGKILTLARSRSFGLLLAPSPLDPHCDHEAGAVLGRRVAARAGLRLGFYAVWSRWRGGGRAALPPGTTAVRLPPGPFAAAKVAAVAAHRSQMGLVVPDDPDGFEMPPGFADFFCGRDEVFFLANLEAAP